MPFTSGNLKIELHDGVDRRFHLLDKLVYHDDIKEGGNGVTYTVPVDVESDGASTPPGTHNIYPPFGRYLKSAVLHDYMYQQAILPRKQADALFRRAMKSQRIPGWKRGSMWLAVRAGGWHIWNKRHKRKKK